MSEKPLRERVAALARKHIGEGDATGWFERLYAEADRNMDDVPWASGEPNPSLLRWLGEQQDSAGACAIVSGCGLGDDAEALAKVGYDVVGFDVADSCVRWCGERFPTSRVNYLQADLFEPPAEWVGNFDLVYDCYTIQALPLNLRSDALQRLVSLAAPGGRILLITMARSDGSVPDGPPWPLARQDLEPLEESGLRLNRFEDFTQQLERRPVRSFVAEYQVPGMGTLPAPSSLDQWSGAL